ncbi:hypothetical protein CCR75_003606 [Bremia lactucae]|uniref:Uncharacterized protein n=1 Tax=Bremia lactucae TaxID=4779 RepID=A0A976FER8_BRELC|nr:hypothetical protein CCR75_003606 [Bremia lactucae]
MWCARVFFVNLWTQHAAEQSSKTGSQDGTFCAGKELNHFRLVVIAIVWAHCDHPYQPCPVLEICVYRKLMVYFDYQIAFDLSMDGILNLP